MKLINIKLFGLIAGMLLIASSSYGQAVYYSEAEGGVVIDCNMMPSGTVLTASQADTENDYQLKSHYANDSSVNKVYPKIVVALEDLAETSLSWTEAVAAAKEYENTTGTSHSDWRLPNQRELMLIFVLHEEIAAAATSGGAIFTPFRESEELTAETWIGSSVYTADFMYWTSTLSIVDTYFNDTDSNQYFYVSFKYSTISVLHDNYTPSSEYLTKESEWMVARAVREIEL